MWKNPAEKTEKDALAPAAKPLSNVPPAVPAAGPATAAPTPGPRTADRPTHIGKSIFVKGTIQGSEDLFVDGKVEGSIELSKSSLTVGMNGQVQADVTAREVVILGKLSGNVTAVDRVEIRSQGALTGDVTAARISIEDGAFFKGGIDIQKAAIKNAAQAG